MMASRFTRTGPRGAPMAVSFVEDDKGGHGLIPSVAFEVVLGKSA